MHLNHVTVIVQAKELHTTSSSEKEPALRGGREEEVEERAQRECSRVATNQNPALIRFLKIILFLKEKKQLKEK